MLQFSAHERKAPYAPISALREFLEKIRRERAPNRIDVAYLERHGIATKNEYALVSALKYLGIIDQRGQPTVVFSQLQGSEITMRETLKHLAEQAYAPLFDAGGAEMSADSLRDWFTQHSSVTQAGNAARFFKEVCQIADISLPGLSQARATAPRRVQDRVPQQVRPVAGVPAEAQPSPIPQAPSSASALAEEPSSLGAHDIERFRARLRLLEKLPPYDERWRPEEYRRTVELFHQMLQSL